MLNRRAFLGAAVAATILPAGDALAAKPASGHAPSDRTIEAHETPEGVLYTVRDGMRETRVVPRIGPDPEYEDVPVRVEGSKTWLERRRRAVPLPPEPFACIVMSYAAGSSDPSTRRVLPALSDDGRVVKSFSRPPSLEDVVAFHERCCAEDGVAAPRG